MSDATTTPTKYVRIYADTIQRGGPCRGEHCDAHVTFAENVLSGKRTPFTGEIVALATERERATGRQIFLVDFEQIHFRSCPDAQRFSGSARR